MRLSVRVAVSLGFRIEWPIDRIFNQCGPGWNRGLHRVERHGPRLRAKLCAAIADLGFELLLLCLQILDPSQALPGRHIRRAIQREVRQSRRRGAQLFEQALVVTISSPLPQRGERVGHGVEDPPFALQQDEGGQRAGLGLAGCGVDVQRDRSVGALRHRVDERELLALGADGEIERQLGFDDRVDAALQRDRVREIANRRVGPRDVPERHQHAAGIRT